MTEAERADFLQAVGECFADAVCPPVPFEQASAHECREAVELALGHALSPARFRTLDDSEITMLARRFADYFESDAPSVAQIRRAVSALVARWP
jgi:hypothetical protein